MPYETLMDSHTIKMLDKIKARSITAEKSKPSMIIIDGGQGYGKTTLAYEIACYLAGKKIEVEKIVGCGGANFQEKYINCSRKKICATIYDEAGDFSKRGALTTFNQMLIRTFETMRAFNIVIIQCLPRADSLDNHLFDIKVPRLLIHIYKDEGYRRRFTVHSLYRMLYIRNKMKDLIVKDKAYFITKPNYIGWFKDLPKEDAEKLKEFTVNEKMKINEKNALRMLGVVSIKDMSKDLNRSTRWITGKLKERNISPEKVMSGKNYYDEKVLDLLAGDVNDN